MEFSEHLLKLINETPFETHALEPIRINLLEAFETRALEPVRIHLLGAFVFCLILIILSNSISKQTPVKELKPLNANSYR